MSYQKFKPITIDFENAPTEFLEAAIETLVKYPQEAAHVLYIQGIVDARRREAADVERVVGAIDKALEGFIVTAQEG